MIKSRLLLHPLLTNTRSRSILISFAITVFGVSAYLWIRILSILNQAGIGFEFFQSLTSVPMLKVLISPVTQIFIVALSIVLAAATTAMSIIGPVKRLEQWLMDWDMGYTLSPLKSRTGDTYDNLIRLINDLYLIKRPPHKTH